MENSEFNKHGPENLKNIPWKAWSVWSSWESPVGLALGCSLPLISLGVFIYLIHLAGLI